MNAPLAAEWKKTACIICSLNCGLEVQTEGRRIVKARGDKDHPTSQGYVCEKSQRMDFYQNGADRITSPKRRCADGSYEDIDWATAIREIADKFGRRQSQARRCQHPLLRWR
jgi:anaerobic selenocysteine-containing dehydrogenase